MSSQSGSFSSQAVLERLTGDHGPQVTSNLDRLAKSNLHALVIGINQYLNHTHLQGAINDANLFKSYLLEDLLVPETQITTLFDAQATRVEIIQAFQKLAADPNINRNDPIVIYYAGHGAEVESAPSRRASSGPFVQCLVPQDAGSKDLSTPGVPPIPDFTISSLLSQIAQAKGDNISVIFDSCHSASITRVGRRGVPRSIPFLCFSPLPEDIDSEIIVENPPISTRSLGTSEEGAEIRGMQSHVLMAACSSKGLAYEDNTSIPHHGYFTKALLKIMRSVGPARLTYKSCIQRLPKFETSIPQDPVCEGINVDRMLFDAKVSGADSSFILLEEKGTQIYLQAGTAHGITPGCEFAIHSDLILDPTNPPLGTMIVDQVTPFRSLLKPREATLGFTIPKPSYGRQIGAGNEHALDIYFTPEFESAIPPDPRWKVAFSGGQNDVVLRLVEKDLAVLIVDVDDSGDATFTFPKLKPAVRNRIATLRHTALLDFHLVYRVISAAARFIWHLDRVPQARVFQSKVKMEFYKLKESGRFEETGSPILEIDGENLNYQGFTRLQVNSKDRYAFCIMNTSSRDIYAYLFYFSINSLEISPRFLQVIGSGQVDPSLPKGGVLTLGYGSGGVGPFQFSLAPGESIGVGVFKLFLSTSPIDLSSVKQDPPFGPEPRRLLRENEAKQHFAALEIGIWDAITMEVELTRPPGALEFENEPEVQHPLTGVDRGVPQVTPPLAGLIPQKQSSLPKDKITRGLVISPNSSPQFSNELFGDLMRPAEEVFNIDNTTITEEVESTGVLDAEFAHLGFPSLDQMSKISMLGNFLPSNDGTQKWTTRRIAVRHLTFSVTPKDFMPYNNFVSDIRYALGRPNDWQKFESFKDVFKTWGTIIPLSGVLGTSSVATTTGPKPDWPRPPLSAELESDNSDNWKLVKVTRVAFILEILGDEFQDQIKQLYAGLVFRSSWVGAYQVFGFDGGMNWNRRIEEIEIGFSDHRIEAITVRYRGGIVAGPHGVSGTPAKFTRFSLAEDESITDILVWATNDKISSIQLLEGGGRASPIYGATQGITQIPKLLSGNGCALIGLSGGFDTFGITQLQAVWRGDIHTKEYLCKQTSHAGGTDGTIWSDLTFLGRESHSRISDITARAPGTGVLGGLQTTYDSLVDEDFVLLTTPVRGTDNGPTVTWELEGERITKVRGRYDGKSICELQFITHRQNHSPAFGQPSGDIIFDIEAPKTSDGQDMVLHHMAGTSDEGVNSILFVWAEPTPGTTLCVFPALASREEDPQANIYKLCAKAHNRVDRITSFEEYSKGGVFTRPTRPNSVKPPLHALIIGIDKYKSNTHLTAAVSDALNFKKYLTDDLLVPEKWIRVLLDEEAKRDDIIKAFQDLAKEDNGVNRDEAIVIYYAGYGSEMEPPPDQSLRGSPVQCIIPQDVRMEDSIVPIPDFTIGALVHKIAQEKGTNITLIFDCCYSAGGSQYANLSKMRFIPEKDLPTLPAPLDRAIILEALSGSNIADLYSPRLEMSTHVLLAACGPDEAAFENREEGYGYFTMALLNTLRSVKVDDLTYEDLMQRLPLLKTNQAQNPVCKGNVMDRILFSSHPKGTNTTFVVIEPKQDKFYLQAGLSSGILPGSKYEIHEGDMFGPNDTIIGTIEVDEVEPFVTRVKDAPNLPTLCYGRQVEYGPGQTLDICVTEAFVEAAEPDEDWSRAFSGKEGDIVLRPATLEMAQVILSFDEKNKTTFTLTNQLSVKHGIQYLPLPGKSPVPPSVLRVTPVLSALAKWNWYLRHLPTTRPFQNFVDMEFYQLQAVERRMDEGKPVFEPDGENLIINGEVNITSITEDPYGIRVVNRSTADLYVYLFSFSPTSLAIKHISTAATSSRSQGALLAQSETLTIGYGSGGQTPLTLPLDKTQGVDASILRLLISTRPSDFEGVEQESPFESNEDLPKNRVKDLFGRDAVWDAVDVNCVYKRSYRRSGLVETDDTIVKPYGGPTIIPTLGSGITPGYDAGILVPMEEEDTIMEPYGGGLTVIPAPGSGIIPVDDAGVMPVGKDDANVQPNGGGLTIIPAPGSGIIPAQDAGIMPVRVPDIAPVSGPGIIHPSQPGINPISEPGIIEVSEPGIIDISNPGILPVLNTDTRPTPMPSAISLQPTAGDTTTAPPSNGVLFTGRSSSRMQVQARSSSGTSHPWFRTPALTQNLLDSIRCMRLRTLAREKGPDGASSSAETGGYFEVSVVAPDGFPKVSENDTEMIYPSHSASQATEWTNGAVFEKDHEIWRNLNVGDCFEVSVCAKGRGWVCEAEMGNLIFW